MARTKAKRGVLSEAERQKIIKWADHMSVKQIAMKLGRTFDIIKEFLNAYGTDKQFTKTNEIPENFKAQVYFELKSTLAWNQTKQEFSNHELEIFKEKFAELVWQFSNDVHPSEKIQLMHVIKLDILMSRVLQQQHKAQEEISRLEGQIQKFRGQFSDVKAMSDADKNLIYIWEQQLGNYRAAVQNYTTEYTKLQKSQFDLMKSVKGTREQRIKNIEDAQTSYLGIIKSLQDQELAERAGQHAALLKLAGDKAASKLAKPHKYMDEKEDLPIYSPETLEALEDGTK